MFDTHSAIINLTQHWSKMASILSPHYESTFWTNFVKEQENTDNKTFVQKLLKIDLAPNEMIMDELIARFSNTDSIYAIYEFALTLGLCSRPDYFYMQFLAGKKHDINFLNRIYKTAETKNHIDEDFQTHHRWASIMCVRPYSLFNSKKHFILDNIEISSSLPPSQSKP